MGSSGGKSGMLSWLTMNIPTLLTLSRLVLAPIFFLLYVGAPTFGVSPVALPYVLLSLLTLSEISDALDGHLARRFNQVTELGKVLDPMADSISRITVFLAFTRGPVALPVVLVFMLLYRDSVVSILRTLCALRGYALAARISGKLKAILQGIAAMLILLLMIPHSMGVLSKHTLQLSSMWIMIVVAIYTVFSGFDYIIANYTYIQRSFSPDSQTS